MAGKATGDTKKLTKTEASRNAIENLQKVCYTIRPKTNFVGQNGDVIEKVDNKHTNNFNDDKINETNIGFKLLKSLGWTGGALGDRKGIVDPIDPSVTVGRAGLGSQAHTLNKGYYRNILRNYSRAPETYDLIFSHKFSDAQRSVLHE